MDYRRIIVQTLQKNLGEDFGGKIFMGRNSRLKPSEVHWVLTVPFVQRGKTVVRAEDFGVYGVTFAVCVVQ